MLLLSGITPNLIVQPASAVTPTTSPMNTLFGAGIYKSLVHVNGADKGEVSPYYHRYLSGYSENSYDSVLFNMDHNLLAITMEEPFNGGFESMASWSKEYSSISGQYRVEQSLSQKKGGDYSLRVKATVSESIFGSAGIFQDMLWEIAPVAADLSLSFSIYPISLENTTKSPDSLLVVEVDFNHYDSNTTVPRMFLVIQDTPGEALSSGTAFVNTANDYYYVLNTQTSLEFEAWNNFNISITDLAVKYYGQIKADNLKIDGLHISAYSRNEAVAEFYVDSVRLASHSSVQETYSRLSAVIKAYDTPALRMVPGEKLDLSSALLYFNINRYFQPAGSSWTNVRKTIDDIHSRGDYVFISKPDASDNYRKSAIDNLWSVDGIAVFATPNRKGFATDMWDYYLNKGVLAMAIAEQHPMSTKDVQTAATKSPTQFVYASDNSPATTIEAMAQGRGFIEAGYVRPMMPLFFSAEDNQVAAGKFPIYVDSSRSKASLNINLQNIPFVAKTLKVVRNGTTVSTIPIQGLTSYNDTLTLSLPDKSNYFRFEVWGVNETVVALSNPIIYVKTSIRPDMWLTLAPSLQYGSAASSISSIKYGSGILSFTATSRDTVQVTTKVSTSKAPAVVTGAQSWKYDNNTKILSINSQGTAKITANFNDVGELSVTTTPVNGPVFVDGASWGTAPVSRIISSGSHIVSFGAVPNYTKPANIQVSIAVGQKVSVEAVYTVIPSTKGNLTVSTTPVNGTVFVDGDLWGTAPVSKVIVTGLHIVSFGAVPNYTKPSDITVSVNTEQNVSVIGNYTLTPPSVNGTLSVTTTPVNGEVFVNGTSLGTAPVNKSVATGSYVVSFGPIPNYTKPVNIQVSVTAENDTEVTGTYIQIPPSNGALSITTTPVNGPVFVDGASWGNAPVNRSISAGSHIVSFGAVSGYTKPENATVSVTAGSTTTITGNYTLNSPAPSGQYNLSFQGYDYDNEGEVVILVNSKVAAVLPVVESPQNSDVFKSFSLNISEYVVSGSNTITFNENSSHASGMKNVIVTGSGGIIIYSNSTYYTISSTGKTEVTYRFNATVTLPPPPSNVTLSISTTPVNGEIFVDGTSWGAAPVNRSIAAGSHTISFGAVAGYTKPVNITISVVAGQNASVEGIYSLIILSPPAKGALFIITTPVDGEVFVNGTSWGIAPVNKSISTGSHTVSFGAVAGYTKPSNITVSVTAGSTTTITGNYTLNSPAPSGQYNLSFQGYDYDNEEEVAILVNNQVVAILPESETPKNSDVFKRFSLNITKYVISGTNTIIFKEIKDHASGLENVTITGSDGAVIYGNSTYYTLSSNGRTQVTYKFNATVTLSPPPPTNGTLSITTTPVNGAVFVDGKSWGNAPVSRSISAGSHTISFSAVPGYTAQSSVTISVTAGQTTTVKGIYTLVSPPPPPPAPPSPPPPANVEFVPSPPVFSPPPAAALPARAATPPTVTIDKDVYVPNDRLVVTGTASPSSTVTIQVLKPNSNILGIEQGTTNAAGAYNVTVLAWPAANSTATPFGTYTIKVTDSYSGATAKSIVFKAAAATAANTTSTTTTTTTTTGQTTTTVTMTRNATVISTVTANVTVMEVVTATTIATATATAVSIAKAVATYVSTVVSTTVTTTTLVGAAATTTATASPISVVASTTTITVSTGLPAEVTYAAVGIAVIAIIAAALLATRRRP